MAEWVDLLDPSLEEIKRHAPKAIDHAVIADLARPASPDPVVRPALQGYGDYVFGRLVAAVLVPEDDRVFYQEIDFILTHEGIVTVRKTPEGEAPYDTTAVKKVCEAKGDLQSGMIAFHILDDVAERYIDLLEAFDDEIDELEEHIEEWSNDRIRKRLSELRHDLLHIRRTLAPTRDAVRGIVDGRVDLEGRPLFRREVFPREVERQFASVYDKLLRASEALELSRDLLAAARDFHQTKIANEQNEVTKKLAVIASLLLLPTFIVGLYGQNFQHHFPEIHWRLGYVWSWGLIVVTTLLQLWFFRRKRWI